MKPKPQLNLTLNIKRKLRCLSRPGRMKYPYVLKVENFNDRIIYVWSFERVYYYQIGSVSGAKGVYKIHSECTLRNNIIL